MMDDRLRTREGCMHTRKKAKLVALTLELGSMANSSMTSTACEVSVHMSVLLRTRSQVVGHHAVRKCIRLLFLCCPMHSAYYKTAITSS